MSNMVVFPVGFRFGRRRSTKTPCDLPHHTIHNRRSRSASDSIVHLRRDDMADNIEISIELRNLHTTTTDDRIVCVLFENDTESENKWIYFASSQPVSRYSNNLRFAEKFTFGYIFERTQLIKVKICAYRPGTAPSNLGGDDVIGSCIFKVDELIGSFGLQLRKTLSTVSTISAVLGPPSKSKDYRGTALITAQLPEKPQPIVIQFRGKSLEKKELFFDESSVFFRVYRVENGEKEDERVLLYESEPVKSHSHPLWKPFSLHTQEIADDRNRLLEFRVFYRDVDGKEGHIGKFLTTYAKMKYGVGPDNVYNIMNEHKAQKRGYENSGKMEMIKFTDVSFYSFLDYIVSGTQLHYVIAVDFSQESEMDIYDKQRFDNELQLAIRAIGFVIRDYSPNRLFPAFGFGAKIPPLFVESQQFHLNFEVDPVCRGLDGVIESYKKSESVVVPTSSASYAPVIHHVTKMALATGDKGMHYYVLVVFTKGGEPRDSKETATALAAATEAPLSIIFAGMGEGDFGPIQKLAGRKMHPSRPHRDAVEFVDVRALIDNADPPGENRARIAEQTLHAVPHQLKDHMHRKGIAAKPPIQVCRSPLFHSSFLIPDRPTEFIFPEAPERDFSSGLLSADHSPRGGIRRGSDSQYLQTELAFAHGLSPRIPERSHSVLQTSREAYQRRLAAQKQHTQERQACREELKRNVVIPTLTLS